MNYKKFLDPLEQYVQWIALGLGLLFLAFIAYTDFFNNPAKAPLRAGASDAEVTPADVDAYVNDNFVARLKTAMASDVSLPPIQVPVVSLEPMETLQRTPMVNPAGIAPTLPIWDSWTFDPDSLISHTNLPAGSLVAELPQTPALTYLDNEFLRTVITVTDAAGNATHQDKDSVTTFWLLPVAKLAQEYAADLGGKLPDAAQATYVLRATLLRQVKTGPGDDDWGPEPAEVVPRMENQTDLIAYPKAGDDVRSYANWAKDHSHEMLAPDYFSTMAYPQRPDLAWMPLDQWVIYRNQQQWNDQQAAQAAATPASLITTSTTPGTAGRPGIGGRNLKGGKPNPNAPAAPADAPPPDPAAAAAQAAQAPPPPPLPPNSPLPTGPFNPGTKGLADNLLVWMHDDTVVPGRIYRYKITYTLENPLLGYESRVAKPELAKQLGLDSPDSDWSPPISVPGNIQFWCAAKQSPMQEDRQLGRTNFDVFTWHDGFWRQMLFTGVPGDEIGADQGPAGNYISHWTYLDTAPRPLRHERNVVVVSDATGEAEVRDAEQDENSPEYKAFAHMMSLQTPATPGAAPTPDQAAANGQPTGG